jgi:CHAT domain-containing protein
MRAVRRAGGRVFTGRRATEAEWRRQSPGASAIHFGGHAATPTPGATTGALVLRASSGHDGLLTIPEILETQVAGSTIVLLSCDTATRISEPGPAEYYRQVPSLGDAFLSAGARAVVGNLWPITETDAQALAVEFYEAGGPARGAAALEEARQALRERFPDLPRRWAGTVWLGAVDRDQSLGRRW